MPYVDENGVKRMFEKNIGYTDDVAVQTITNTQNSILNIVRAEPLDLTVAFADEIKNFSSAWTWIQDRIKNTNWDGLMVGDYIPISVTHSGSTYTFNMQIAGIDVYYNTGNTAITTHHIDFISKEVTPWTVQWNTTNNNNGTADQNAPYMASNLHDHLVNTVLGELPQELQNVIIEKHFRLETRYSSSGTLTDANSYVWTNIGKLWVPSSVEVCGNTAWIHNQSSFGDQYPIFACDTAARIKCNAGTSTRATWWTLCPYSGNSTPVVSVSYGGNVNYNNASASYTVPLCVRVSY